MQDERFGEPGAPSIPTRSARLGKWVCLTACIVTCLLCYNSNLDGPLDMYHEGDRLATYDAISDGALPFRDYYVSHGLGEDVIKPYLACKVFGPSVASLRRLGQNSFTYRGYLPILGPLAILVAGMAWLRSPVSIAVLALLIAVSLYEISERPAFAMAAVAALGMWHTSRKIVWIVICGVLAGLATLYSTETGIYASIAIGIWLLIPPTSLPCAATQEDKPMRSRPMVWFIVGTLCIALPFLLWCASQHILSDYIENLRIQFTTRSEVWKNIYPKPAWVSGQPVAANLLVGAVVVAIYYLLPAIYLAAIAICFSRALSNKKSERSMFLLASLVGLTFWLSPLTQSDLWHVAFVTGTFFFFAAVCTDVMIRRVISGMVAAALMAGIVVVSAALVFVGQGGTAYRKLTGTDDPRIPAHLQSSGRMYVRSHIARIGDIWIPVDQAAELSKVVSIIQENSGPDDYLLDLSDQGLLYFLSERRCPTRFHLLSQCNSPDLRQRMVDDIRSRDRLPRIVMMPGTDPPGADVVGRFVAKNYRPLTTMGGLQFFILNRE